MGMLDEDILGEGATSIVRRGVHVVSGEEVAIKMSRASRHGSREAVLKKFERQIEVLAALAEPFAPPSDPGLWHEQLEHVQPCDLFMRMIDYSRDVDGLAPIPLTVSCTSSLSWVSAASMAILHEGAARTAHYRRTWCKACRKR